MARTPTFADPYATRVTAARYPIHRPDPIVWGSAGDGPINAATLASHSIKGYHLVEGLLSPAEVRAYWRELVRLSGDGTLTADERVVIEKSSGQVRSIFEVHKISELIAELVCDPRILDRARQILGSEVYLHQSRIDYVPGFTGTGYYWHSDFETWHAEDGMPRPRAVGCSLALTDNHPFNGSLMIIPSSQRVFVPCVAHATADDQDSPQHQKTGVPSRRDLTALAAGSGIDQFTGPPGSALWFDSNVMHGSGNNITPYPRSNIFLVFNSVENTLVEPYAASAPRPSFISSRDFTPLVR
ncbi:ectoine hydroxylase [Amycolatopsis sp. GM8]|uniref:ectoine hydroxylase n=1 Tax=Amycolatopsis sp. GM8 TaxID=2896530 RepID=UPI001F3B39B6|nr:ectoine hydroxylase [Amycolatopsis sp. GM8]